MSLGTDIGNQLIAIIEKVRESLLEYDFATKEFVEEVLATTLSAKVVDKLPEVGEERTIYLVPVASNFQSDKNLYKEWMYIKGVWEDLGSTDINFEDYPNKDKVDELLKAKLNKNDPSIPKNLSDLIVDEASRFVTLNVVSKLPELADAEVNAIYVVYNEVTSTHKGEEVILKPVQYLGTSMSITNNGGGVVKLYKTDVDKEIEDEVAVLEIAAGAKSNFDVPAICNQLRFESDSNVNVSILWTRSVSENYLEYIKVKKADGSYAWEVVGNPEHVTYAFLRENYYRKGEIYTKETIIEALENLIEQLDNVEYDTSIIWDEVLQPEELKVKDNWKSIVFNGLGYFLLTSDGCLITSPDLKSWNEVGLSGLETIVDTVFVPKSRNIIAIDEDGNAWRTKDFTEIAQVATGVGTCTGAAFANTCVLSSGYVSTDGGETFERAPIGSEVVSMYHDGLQFVAICSNGDVLSSFDGKVWGGSSKVDVSEEIVASNWDGTHAVLLTKTGKVIKTRNSLDFSDLEVEALLVDTSSDWVDAVYGTNRNYVALSASGELGLGHTFCGAKGENLNLI